jgi:protein-L-isoaspartate(D-aspartate) O-methyltransferase
MKLSRLDRYWSDYNSSGRDFLQASHYDAEKILSYVSESGENTALDIGCGTGALVREINKHKYSVTGVDASSVAIKRAHTPESHIESICFVHRDVEKNGLKDLRFSPFKLATCRLVFAFIDNKRQLLEELKKVLQKNGVFVIISPIIASLPEEKKEIGVDVESTLKILEDYFEVEVEQSKDTAIFICRIN